LADSGLPDIDRLLWFKWIVAALVGFPFSCNCASLICCLIKPSGKEEYEVEASETCS
jgi:hypothetical protein